jgi:hypothetical protein
VLVDGTNDDFVFHDVGIIRRAKRVIENVKARVIVAIVIVIAVEVGIEYVIAITGFLLVIEVLITAIP